MNAIFKACLPALLLLIALSPLAHADNLPAPMLDDPRFSFLSTVPRDDITLKYDASKIPDMFNLMTTAKGAHEEVAEYFSGYPFRATVVVVGSNPDFRLVLNVGDAPDTLNAWNWNTGYNGLILIKSPGMVPNFKQVLEHQMMRISIRTRLNTTYQSVPIWYQDGLASHVAGETYSNQNDALATMAVTGKWMSLDELEKTYRNITVYNYDDEKYLNARAHAAALVDLIANRYGRNALLGIIDDYTADGNMTQAFINRTNLTPDLLNSALSTSFSSDTGTTAGSQPVSTPTPTPAPTATPAPTPTPVPAGAGHQATTGTSPAPTGDAGSWLATDDLMLYGIIAMVNVIGIIAVALILKRNWH
jgi:hypothetical protein